MFFQSAKSIRVRVGVILNCSIQSFDHIDKENGINVIGRCMICIGHVCRLMLELLAYLWLFIGTRNDKSHLTEWIV